jgi:hypothetical protein
MPGSTYLFKVLILLVTMLSTFSFQENKPLMVDDFVQSQTNTYINSTDVNSLSFVITLENLHQYYQSKTIALKAIKPHSSALVDNKKVYSRIDIWQFDYKNEALCREAHDSLLNCFLHDCTALDYGTDQSIKMTPCIFIMGKTTIAIAKTSCEQVDSKWTQFTKDFTEYYAIDEESKIILGSCGKIQWVNRSELLNDDQP